MAASLEEPHVPILVSPNIETASRVIVVFGEPTQDLGVWAYRTIGGQSIDIGSAVSFSRAVLGCEDVNREVNGGAFENCDKKDTALVLANTGQLIWHCGSATAMAMPTWLALPRKSAVDPPLRMTYRNKILRNENWEAHIKCVFEEVLADRGFLPRKDTKISIIGLAEGGLGVMNYLATNCGITYSLSRFSSCSPSPPPAWLLPHHPADLLFPQ
jgi:hypothetical protein